MFLNSFEKVAKTALTGSLWPALYYRTSEGYFRLQTGSLFSGHSQPKFRCRRSSSLDYRNSSHFSPRKISPGLISPELFLQQIIIPEHNSPVGFISRNKVLQLIINLRLFYAKEYSPGTKFSENKYFRIHSSPGSN